MYVCICNAVTDRQIRAVVAAGASSLDEVTMELGVGACCGCCRETAQQLIHDVACGGNCASCHRREVAVA